ncbi:uncharacterized protein LOC100214234 [Hydra vulgaris]|uniref:uncharacterized protein LOC100214234 n=1 Tax=Hydra vulgaris TaxID=6087 RepID=UPI0006418737|nr:uncharacterized protein LOC100214234 [Hydra vulgaris]
MCLSCEMDDKWPPFIEFMIWFFLHGLSVGNHFGVWAVVKVMVLDLDYTNKTLLSNATDCYNLTVSNNCTEYPWNKLEKFRTGLLVCCFIGASFFVVHIFVLLPNIIQSFRVPDPLSLKISGGIYFQNLLKCHVILLILETLLFDIPAGCITMEVVSLIWEGPLSIDTNMKASKIIFTLSLVGLAFIALYKGMMPLFLWIGNPFCFPCIPLRLLVVFPGGLIALVMVFGPAMGVARSRLLQFAPTVLQAEIGELANTFFSVGMIFWGVFIIVFFCSGFLWYKVCREGASGDICSLCC